MSTASELKDKEITSRERIAREDRASRERIAHHDRLANVMSKSMPQFKVGINDPAWYKKVLGLDEANLSLSTFHRYNLPDSTICESGTWTMGCKSDIPSYVGVYAINYAPTLGSSAADISSGSYQLDVSGGAINAALNRVLSQLEKRNSRITTYSRDTIGRYLFISSDVLTDLLTVKVVIELYDLAKTKFPYIAPALIQALGFDAQTVRSNIAWIKSEYCRLASVFNNSIPIPAELSYVSRKIWVATHIILDHAKTPSQFIAFCKSVYYVLSSNDNYVANPIPNTTGHNAITYLRSIETRIDTLCNGATWKPVIRDLRGGMPEKAFAKITSDLAQKVVVFSEVDEVREQFHNMDCVPGLVSQDVSTTNVVAKKGLIFESFSVGGDTKEQVHQGLAYGGNGSKFGGNTPGVIALGATSEVHYLSHGNNMTDVTLSIGTKLGLPVDINLFHDSASADDLLTATRLKTTWAVSTMVALDDSQLNVPLATETGNVTFLTKNNPIKVLMPLTMGTELVLGIRAVLFDVNDPYTVKFNQQWCTVIPTYNTLTQDYDVVFSDYMENNNSFYGHYIITMLGLFQQVDWIPLCTIIGYNVNDMIYKFTIGELANYFTIDSALYARINRQCVESEFTIAESSFLKPLA